jgi:Na+/melibiose symporter-like transporter
VQGLAFFTPTIVKTIYPHNSVISQQLHTVPPYIVGTFMTILIPFLSWRFDRRLMFFIIGAPLMMTGYIMFLASENPQVRYGATFIIGSGAFAFGALTNAHVSANVVSDTARASAIATNVMFGNIGGLISTWSFLPFDAPNYKIGNGLNLATSSTILLTSIALMFWMKASNNKRKARHVEEELGGLTVQEQQDLDWKHPSFMWKL